MGGCTPTAAVLQLEHPPQHGFWLLQGLPPSRILYNTLVRGYCKLGVAGQARALELLREMRVVRGKVCGGGRGWAWACM